MRIRMLMKLGAVGGPYFVRRVYDLPEAVAQEWVVKGFATVEPSAEITSGGEASPAASGPTSAPTSISPSP